MAREEEEEERSELYKNQNLGREAHNSSLDEISWLQANIYYILYQKQVTISVHFLWMRR
jgi:hypothetical protein